MDESDIANDYAERLNNEALSQRTRFVGKSAEECVDCGDHIPSERREAIRGVQTCYSCAQDREKQL